MFNIDDLQNVSTAVYTNKHTFVDIDQTWCPINKFVASLIMSSYTMMLFYVFPVV